MKVLWFHLMGYPDVPADWLERNRSIWVDIEPSMFDPQVGHRAYNNFIDEMELAASLGFDGIGVNEHHANAYALGPSPNLIASILARTSQDAALLVLGDSIALYNPPLRIAEEMALIDCISGGRLIAGFPVGSPMDTVFAYGTNPAHLREKYDEGLELILRAWKEREVFSFNGNYTKLRYVNCWPRPLQDPHPPVWIPGGTSIDTWEWTAANDYCYLFLSYFGFEPARAVMDGYWKARRAAGREPNPFAGGFVQLVGVAETEKEAYDLYREPALYFTNVNHTYVGYVDPPGYKTVRTVRAGLEGMVERAAREAAARTGAPKGHSPKLDRGRGLTFEEMVERGHFVIGDPDQVAAKLRHIAKELTVGNLLLLCQFGNMRTELTRYNTQLMAERVLPQIRDLHENQWENNYWIKPPRSEAPAGPDPAVAVA